MRLVLVIWTDAGGRSGWQDVDQVLNWAEQDEEFSIVTVGFVMAESEEALLLAPSVSGNKVLDPIRIPQRAIEHIEDISLEDEEEEDGE